jgi:hypothetical protein
MLICPTERKLFQHKSIPALAWSILQVERKWCTDSVPSNIFSTINYSSQNLAGRFKALIIITIGEMSLFYFINSSLKLPQFSF